MLIKYLKEHKTIIQDDARRILSIGRLSDVVLRLKADGYDIRTEKVKVINQFGRATHYARYHLVGL